MTTATRHDTRHATPTSDWRRRPETLTTTWESRSACYNRPEAWWDGDDPQLTKKARPVCRSCPVFAECVDTTMTLESSLLWARTGVRGGLTGPERVQLWLDERDYGPYDAEEARLLALEAVAEGRKVADVADGSVSQSTVRLAARLAGERVAKRKPPTMQQMRGGSARERAFRRAEDIMRWRQEEGLSLTKIAARLRMGREPVSAVIRELEQMASVPTVGKAA